MIPLSIITTTITFPPNLNFPTLYYCYTDSYGFNPDYYYTFCFPTEIQTFLRPAFNGQATQETLSPSTEIDYLVTPTFSYNYYTIDAGTPTARPSLFNLTFDR